MKFLEVRDQYLLKLSYVYSIEKTKAIMKNVDVKDLIKKEQRYILIQKLEIK